MDNKDLVSIIVPVYNVQDYLERCIKSLINQSYKNLEIILVNDGSKDNSKLICEKYKGKDNRIKVINQENKGVSIARNRGIEESKGIFLTFVDGDDWIESDYIKIMVDKIINTNADMIFCGFNKIYKNNIEKINLMSQESTMTNREFLKSILRVQNGCGNIWAKLIRKDIVKDIRFESNLIVAEDALFNLKLCKNIRKIIYIPLNLYNYQINSSSVVRKFENDYYNKYLEAMNFISKYLNNNYKNDLEIQKSISTFIVYHIILIAVNYCCHPDNQENSIKSLKKICNIELFKEALKNSNYECLSFTRKVTLFTLKHKLYILTAIICKIRQMQIK